MSNKELIIEERSRDLGNFLVGRLLPFRKKRMIGPFIFLDHMGPSEMTFDKNLTVDQHPHIGLATLTYLLEGEILHEDSIGTSQIIKPGAVNWMVAGKGITHTERTPEHLKATTFNLHGYQIWIALPKTHEDIAPEFHHIKANDVPSWSNKGIDFRLIAGKAFGKVSSLKTFSDLFMVELIVKEDQNLDLAGQLFGEIGIVVTKGSVVACEEEIESGNLIIAKDEKDCQFIVKAGSHLFIIGGTPFPEKRFIDWNFVSSDIKKITKAKEEWKTQSFVMMNDDSTYVPYPTVSK